MYLLLFCNNLLTEFTAQASAVPGAAQSAVNIGTGAAETGFGASLPP